VSLELSQCDNDSYLINHLMGWGNLPLKRWLNIRFCNVFNVRQQFLHVRDCLPSLKRYHLKHICYFSLSALSAFTLLSLIYSSILSQLTQDQKEPFHMCIKNLELLFRLKLQQLLERISSSSCLAFYLRHFLNGSISEFRISTGDFVERIIGLNKKISFLL